AVADAEGRFRIENLPADHYISLWAYHRDHPQSFFVAAIGPHATPQPLVERQFGNSVRQTPVQVNPLKLTLRRGPRVRVRVLDQAGNPPRGGRVSLFVRLGGRKWQEDALPADGLLAWAALSTGAYRVIYVPADEGAFCLNQAVSLGNAEFETPKEVRMVLPSGGELSGRVVGEGTKKALEGVTVIWSSTLVDGDWSDAASSKAVTDRDGRFQIRALPGNGRIKLLGNAPGFFIDNHRRQTRAEPGEYRYPVDVPQEGPMAPLALEVPRGLTIRGRVTDKEGRAVPGIVVGASRDVHIRIHAATTVTDAEGGFEISGLNPRHDYQLSAIDDSRAGYTVVEGEPRQPWNESRSVEAAIVLEPTVTLTGRVLLAGDPQAGVRLKLKRHHDFKEIDGPPLGDNRRSRAFASQSTELQTVLTGADGRYSLGGLKAGDSYSIEVEPPFPAIDASWPHQSPHIPKLPANAQGEVKLPDMKLRRLNQSLAGMVVDPDGKPVSGARVSAMLRKGHTFVNRASRSGPLPWTETDAQGRFRLEQLPDEPLSLMAYIQKGGGGPIRFPARVSVELNQQDIRIVLDPSLVEEEK
ncbi:MAG: MSCRAMM family protein, partial [Pirellulales bacterium]